MASLPPHMIVPLLRSGPIWVASLPPFYHRDTAAPRRTSIDLRPYVEAAGPIVFGVRAVPDESSPFGGIAPNSAWIMGHTLWQYASVHEGAAGWLYVTATADGVTVEAPAPIRAINI